MTYILSQKVSLTSKFEVVGRRSVLPCDRSHRPTRHGTACDGNLPMFSLELEEALHTVILRQLR